LKHTCRSATCFFAATLFDQIAHNTIVIVDPRYVANAIEKAASGGKIPAATIARDMINIKLHDCTNIVNNNPIQKNIHGLIWTYSLKSTISVTKANQSFIKEKAKKIIPRLNINLLIVTTLLRRERKFNQIAHKNIRGNAIIETFKLNHTIHKIELVIIVPILDQRITANAEVRERIPVHTNASTSTETTFELCNIVVINIQLQKDFSTDEVNFFSNFLNHQFVTEETACSKYCIQNRKNPSHHMNCNIHSTIETNCDDKILTFNL